MERWLLKLVLAIAYFILSLICTQIPFKLSLFSCKRCRSKNKSTKKSDQEMKNKDGSVTSVQICERPYNFNHSTTEDNFNIKFDATNGSISCIDNREMQEENEQNTINRHNDNVETVEKSKKPKKGHKRDKILGWLMCFGGGVFFGTFLLHMLPEVKIIISYSFEIAKNNIYPIAELITGAGFFVVLIFDEAVTSFRSRQLKKKMASKEKEKKLQNASIEETVERFNIDDKNNIGMVNDCCGTGNLDVNNNLEQVKWTLSENSSSNILIGASNSATNLNPNIGSKTDKKTFCSSENNSSHPNHNKNEKLHKHHHDHDDEDEAHQHNHATRSIVMVLALSLHHLFEGLSIGLQMSASNVWHLTVAVMCHETAICFSMGLQFFKTDKKWTKKVFVILLVACIIGPGGIIIGLCISEIGGHEHDIGQNTVNGVLQAIACGTFIYVTFFEILMDELGQGKASLSKIFCMVLGFIFMALLGLIPESVENSEQLVNATRTNETNWGTNFTTSTSFTNQANSTI